MLRNEDADRRAVGLALEDAGPDFRHVVLLALGDELRLPRPAAAQIGQQIVHAQRQTRRAAVDDAQIAGTVADAGGGDAEQFAEGVSRHNRIILPLWVTLGGGNRVEQLRCSAASDSNNDNAAACRTDLGGA